MIEFWKALKEKTTVKKCLTNSNLVVIVINRPKMFHKIGSRMFGYDQPTEYIEMGYLDEDEDENLRMFG
jgi:hypothetical protein